MCPQGQAPAVVHQGVAGDAGLFVVGPAEAAVDADHPAGAFHRGLPLHRPHRHVAVDDVAAALVQAELRQDGPVHAGVVDKAVIGVAGLGVGGLVLHEQPLERGHLCPAVEGRELAAPQIPQKVAAGLPGLAALGGEVGPAGPLVAVVHQRPAGVAVLLEGLHLEAAGLGEGDGPVEQQVAVFDVVHPALGVQKAHVPLQPLAVGEAAPQRVDDLPLVGGETGRIRRVHGGQVVVQQGVALALHLHRARGKVDAAQKVPPLQLKIRVAVDHRALQLEHDHRDGLVHPGHPGQLAPVVGAPALVHMGIKMVDVAVPVGVLGEEGQRPGVDAVAVLHRLQVVVGQGGAQHGGDTHRAARRRAHPDHVVVAPLDVHRVVGHQLLQDQVRPGAPVEDVAQDVQLEHRQRFDQLAQGLDEVVRPAHRQDAVQDLAVVEFLVVVLEVGVEQFVQDVGVVFGQPLAHKAAGVLAGHHPADVDEAEQGLPVPGVQVSLAVFQFVQLAGRVVDEGGKLRPLLRAHRVSQHPVHLFLDDPGGVVHDVGKGLRLAVEIAHEVLGALGQLEDGLQVDDLAAGAGDGGVLPGQQGEILQVFTELVRVGSHGARPFVCLFKAKTYPISF